MYRRTFGILTILLLLSNTCLAEEGLFGRFGLGFNAPDQHSASENKFFSLGYQSPFGWGDYYRLFDWKAEAGGWSDSSNRAGRKSNGFVAGSVGLEPSSGCFYMHSFAGLAAVALTDSTLGSVPEFTEDVGFGFKDESGRRMGLDYKHFSNAGVWQPNRGRDFLTVMMGIPF